MVQISGTQAGRGTAIAGECANSFLRALPGDVGDARAPDNPRTRDRRS